MAQDFSEEEIDMFRDCFYLNCKSGTISNCDQLKFVMRSVGFSPTNDELAGYLKEKKNSIKFADFLDCAHAHRLVEKVPEEILRAFEVSPFVNTRNSSNISLDTLRHVMCNWGERFTHREFNALIKEMNMNKPEISYSQLVSSLVAPESRRRQ